MSAAEYNKRELERGNITWEDLSKMVELAQGVLKVKPDGYFGPVTKEALYPAGSDEYWIDDDGWLHGPGVEHIPIHQSWFGGPQVPLGIVDHTSDTEANTARNMGNRRTKPHRPRQPHHTDADQGKLFDRMASWHLSIDQIPPTPGGDALVALVVQQVPFTRKAWHAGSDTAKKLPFGWANNCTIGVELISEDDKDFTQRQINTYAKVKRAIVKKYGIPSDRAAIAHGSIDPKRRSDPGKLYAEKFNEYVLNIAYAA